MADPDAQRKNPFRKTDPAALTWVERGGTSCSGPDACEFAYGISDSG
jgi:hypothetical protein